MSAESEFIVVGEEFWVDSLNSSKKLMQCYAAMMNDRMIFNEAAKKMRILEEPEKSKLVEKDRLELVAILCSRATGILQRDENEIAALEEEERAEIENLLDSLIADNFSNWLFLSVAKSVRKKKKFK